MPKVDADFYKRADAHIFLSNEQVKSKVGRGKVSSSMMYGTARFNAWVLSTTFSSKDEMENSKDEIVEYFAEQYKKMLLDNVNDYIKNFDIYGAK